VGHRLAKMSLSEADFWYWQFTLLSGNIEFMHSIGHLMA